MILTVLWYEYFQVALETLTSCTLIDSQQTETVSTSDSEARTDSRSSVSLVRSRYLASLSIRSPVHCLIAYVHFKCIIKSHSNILCMKLKTLQWPDWSFSDRFSIQCFSVCLSSDSRSLLHCHLFYTCLNHCNSSSAGSAIKVFSYHAFPLLGLNVS